MHERETPRTWLQRGLARLGRALDPGAASDRERLRALVHTVEDWRERDEARMREVIDRLRTAESASDALRQDAAARQRELTSVRGLFTKQRDLLSRVLRRAHVEQRSALAEQRVVHRLRRLSRSRLPIIVGPWTGEVGFELLYWIPFLQWVRETFPFEAGRLIAVSRGGVRAWYGNVTSEYEDILARITPDEFRAATEDRKKQQRVRVFDRVVVKGVMRARGIRHAHVLHPTLMYALFNAFWRYDATVRRVQEFSRFKALPPIDAALAGEVSLPERFIAVRFYFSDCFPDTPENRWFAASVVDGLAARTDVVLLNNHLVIDDHRDYVPAHASRVHVLSPHMRPETNLAIQTAAISRASGFVGTYGGYSYLAPLYGVSSIAFYSRASFKRHHLELAHRAFQRMGGARLMPVEVRQAGLLVEGLAGTLGAVAPAAGS